MSDRKKPKLSHAFTNAKSGVTWLVWYKASGKMLSRKMKYKYSNNEDDEINFAAYSCCPEGVAKPSRGINPKYIHFQWSGKSLADLDEDFPTNLPLFYRLTYQTLKCMAEMHSRGITHGNLSKKKIFYYKSKFKIAYFEKGSKSEFLDPISSISSLPLISDAEQKNLILNKKIDVKNLGLILLKCIKPNFPISKLGSLSEGAMENFVERKIRKLDLRIRNLFRKMLTFHDHNRCSMEEVFQDWETTVIAVEANKSLNERTVSR
ncbi:unnamed protein product [Blepharisma stoltei]|uniref:Protein kinase domain-containing protein n=1 Tax=Blepharisma stoltei TaxID=1481888 RepID=A0AAU9JP37_9CILI|nr:unnamed protein product [Blepharisma stoltei]